MRRMLVATALLGAAACTSRRPRWHYGPLEDRPAATADGTGARSFDPAAMERMLADQGCIGCHTFHGERLVGPALTGLEGQKRRLRGGGEVLVDQAYVVESLYEPSAKVVDGYPDVMPSYAERIDEADADALAAYLLSLR